MYNDYMENVFDRKNYYGGHHKVGDIYLYNVKAGDNVYRIARMFNTRVEFIVCMNNLDNEMKIYPNQRLFIPVIRQREEIEQPRDSSYELYF